MTESAAALSAWESLYVIVGSSGGALIGLQFVVITLIADRRQPSTPAALTAFGTPTVVHLTGALGVSAIMSAPWPSFVGLARVIELCGLAGVAYGAIVVRRAHRQSEYRPVWQDWVWYAALPSAAYALLTLGGAMLHGSGSAAPFVIATAAIGLLLIGIHNAWDSVTHIALHNQGQTQNGE